MGKKILIMGGSGVGMIVSSIIDRLPGMRLLGFLNDVCPVGTMIGKFKKVPIIGTSQDVYRFLKDPDTYLFNGFIGMTHEKKVYEKLISMDVPLEKYINIIDPTAIIPTEYCSIGRGVLMAPLSQLSSDTVVSDNCMLLANSFVGHDSVLDRYVSVATNAVIGGNVYVGKAVHVGSNAVIREKVKIGDFSLIGSGSVVLKDVPPGCIVAGNPAKIIRYTQT